MAKRGRKTNNENGVVASRQISLKVTDNLYFQIKALAYVYNGGNINALITSMLERAAAERAKDKNFLEALRFVKSVETQTSKFKKNAEIFAQDNSTEVPTDSFADEGANIDTP